MLPAVSRDFIPSQPKLESIAMWEQIQSNKRKTIVLVIAMAAVLFGLGFVIAEASAPGAGILGLLVAWSATPPEDCADYLREIFPESMDQT